MRSEQVFRASEQIANRYMLCRLTAKTTRCLHFASANTHDAIEDAFVRLGLGRELYPGQLDGGGRDHSADPHQSA